MAPGVRNKLGPMFEPKVFRKQMYCIEESILGAPIVIRRPGNCAPLASLAKPMSITSR